LGLIRKQEILLQQNIYNGVGAARRSLSAEGRVRIPVYSKYYFDWVVIKVILHGRNEERR